VYSFSTFDFLASVSEFRLNFWVRTMRLERKKIPMQKKAPMDAVATVF